MIKTIHHWTNQPLKDFELMSQNKEETTGLAILGYVEYQYDSLATKEFFESIVDLANELNVPLYILTLYSQYDKPLLDLSNLRYRNIKIISWPEGFLIKTYEMICANNIYQHNTSIGLELHNIKATDEMKNFTHPFISLVRLAKTHRCVYMDLLAKYDLIKLGAVGWREYSEYPFKYWKEKILLVDQPSENPRDDFTHLHIPEISVRSFMQVAVETNPHIFILSEKTTYPIFFNKPFLTVGCANYHAILEKLGFKLYDEIFDYSFDCKKDMRERYEGLVKNVVNICNKTPEEWQEMYELVSEKIEYNKLHALNIARSYDNYPDIFIKIATQEGHDSEPVHFINNIKHYVNEYSIKL